MASSSPSSTPAASAAAAQGDGSAAASGSAAEEPQLKFRVVTAPAGAAAFPGSHVLAGAPLPRNTAVMFEPPLVRLDQDECQQSGAHLQASTTGQADAAQLGLPNTPIPFGAELLLTAKLMALVERSDNEAAGIDRAWLATYAQGDKLGEISRRSLQQLLETQRAKAGAGAETAGNGEAAAAPPSSAASPVDMELAEAVYRAVCGNAFALETTMFRVGFGAAFFKDAARLNHSCDANGTSLRLGGCMVVYAVRDISPGEEITHSYLAPLLLVQNKAARESHLHFACQCARCHAETPAVSARLAELHVPAAFKDGDLKQALLRFKVASMGASPLDALVQGDELLAAAWDVLREAPIMALELADSYLGSFLVARCDVSSSEQHAMSTGIGSQGGPGYRCTDAARLYFEAAQQLRDINERENLGIGRAALDHLVATGAFYMFLLDCPPRAQVLARFKAALAVTNAMYGNLPGPPFLYLREDMTVISATQWREPSLLSAVASISANRQISSLDRVRGFQLDICRWCGKAEEAVGSFQRCARCRQAKYCCREHQRSDWKVHKRTCREVEAAGPV